MADENLDVSSESSPESSESAETSQATTQPAQQQTQTQEPPFHQHPRFREITSQNRQLKEQLAQVVRQQAAMAQHLQRQQNQNPDAPMSAEDRQKYAEAAQALRRVLQQDPELQRLLMLAQRA